MHAIESHILDPFPGSSHVYCTWKELEDRLKVILEGSKSIAMEYSPRNAIPYVSKVDAGTIEMIRSFDISVESSANLLQHFTSIWDKAKFKMHLEAADTLSAILQSKPGPLSATI